MRLRFSCSSILLSSRLCHTKSPMSRMLPYHQGSMKLNSWTRQCVSLSVLSEREIGNTRLARPFHSSLPYSPTHRITCVTDPASNIPTASQSARFRQQLSGLLHFGILHPTNPQGSSILPREFECFRVTHTVERPARDPVVTYICDTGAQRMQSGTTTGRYTDEAIQTRQ